MAGNYQKYQKVEDGEFKLTKDVPLDGITLQQGKTVSIVGISFGGYLLLEYGPASKKTRHWVHPSKLQ